MDKNHTVLSLRLAFIYLLLISYVVAYPKENKNLLGSAIIVINLCIAYVLFLFFLIIKERFLL